MTPPADRDLSTPAPDSHTPADPLIAFLLDRLTEDLAQVWAREEARSSERRRPGMSTVVAAIDELLVTLRAGQLPSRRELRVLLHGYGAHPAYDPAWTGRLTGP